MTGSVLRILLLGGAVALVTIASAAAEDQVIDFQTSSDADKVAKTYKVETAVPSSPAFAIIGSTPSKAVTGGFTPDLVWEALGGEDDFPGFGVAVKPYWLIGPGRQQTLKQYQGPLAPGGDDKSYRGANDYSLNAFLGRTSLSAAIGAREGKKDAALALGLGIHTSFFPTADPRLDRRLTKCLDTALWGTQPEAPNGVLLPPGAPLPPPKPAPELKGEAFRRLKSDASRFLTMRNQESRFRTQSHGLALGELSSRIGELEASKDEATIRAEFAEIYAKTGPADNNAAAELAAMRERLLASLPAPKPAPDDKSKKPVATDGRPLVKMRTLPTVGEYAVDSTACYNAAKVRLANVEELSFGLGAVALSPQRRGDDLDYAGTSVWVTYRRPINAYLEGCNSKNPLLEVADGTEAARDTHCLNPQGNVSVFSRYTWDEKVPISDTVTANAALGIMGVAFQKTAQNDRWSFELAASYNWRNFTTAGYDDEEYWRLSAEASVRLSDFARLNVGYGTVTDSPIGEDDFTIVRLVLATSIAGKERKEK